MAGEIKLTVLMCGESISSPGAPQRSRAEDFRSESDIPPPGGILLSRTRQAEGSLHCRMPSSVSKSFRWGAIALFPSKMLAMAGGAVGTHQRIAFVLIRV